MRMSRLFLMAALAIATCGVGAAQNPAPPQTATAPADMPAWQVAAGGHMKFEVASIHALTPDSDLAPPSFPLSYDDRMRPTGGIFHANYPVLLLLSFAYKLTPDEINLVAKSLPLWARSVFYNVQASSENKNPTKDQFRLMVQSLLEERFRVKVHFETQQIPAYALTLEHAGRFGPNLKLHTDGPSCEKPVNAADPGSTRVVPVSCATLSNVELPGGRSFLGSRNATMDQLVDRLNLGAPERPFLNRMALADRADFTLVWGGEEKEESTSGPQSLETGLSLLEALREELGMNVDAVKAPMRVLVVDRVEKPSEN